MSVENLARERLLLLFKAYVLYIEFQYLMSICHLHFLFVGLHCLQAWDPVFVSKVSAFQWLNELYSMGP